jgi:hypothetical protein
MFPLVLFDLPPPDAGLGVAVHVVDGLNVKKMVKLNLYDIIEFNNALVTVSAFSFSQVS